jgi:glycosyltransferase involved in cell wall biosynthesis
MNYLIVDLNIKLDGHKLGFVQNIIDYLEKNSDTKNQYYFLSNYSKDFRLKKKKNSQIELFALTETQQNSVNSKKRFLEKSHLEWTLILEKAKELKIERLILMELDPYQLSIFRSKVSFDIYGIWFRPYHRMEQEAKGLKNYLKFNLFKFQKKITLFLALRNKSLKKVFILNDELLPDLPICKPPRFFYLPDPCFPYKQQATFNLRQKYNISSDKVIFLQFGFIDERKNTENILLALNSLQKSISEKVALLIIGKFKENYEQTLRSIIPSHAQYQTLFNPQFISDSEMESTFSQSDVILRMNINFFGSSGIVGIAANHDKPCIVSNFGVMADQVEEYNMGVIIDPYDIEEIMRSIQTFIENPDQRKVSGKAYREAHTAEKFVQTLLDI